MTSLPIQSLAIPGTHDTASVYLDRKSEISPGKLCLATANGVRADLHFLVMTRLNMTALPAAFVKNFVKYFRCRRCCEKDIWLHMSHPQCHMRWREKACLCVGSWNTCQSRTNTIRPYTRFHQSRTLGRGSNGSWITDRCEKVNRDRRADRRTDRQWLIESRLRD